MAKPKSMRDRKMVSLPSDLVAGVENFRFDGRFKTEADAIRELIRLGLAAHAVGLAPALDSGDQNKIDRLRAMLKALEA